MVTTKTTFESHYAITRKLDQIKTFISLTPCTKMLFGALIIVNVIPLSGISGLDIRTRNGLYPLLFVNVRYMFFKCSVYVLQLSSAKERYRLSTFDKFAGKF